MKTLMILLLIGFGSITLPRDGTIIANGPIIPFEEKKKPEKKASKNDLFMRRVRQPRIGSGLIEPTPSRKRKKRRKT
jgi:hypothetical protein